MCYCSSDWGTLVIISNRRCLVLLAIFLLADVEEAVIPVLHAAKMIDGKKTNGCYEEDNTVSPSSKHLQLSSPIELMLDT